MAKSLEITNEQGGRILRLTGLIDENADLTEFSSLTGRVEMHLGGVRRINSSGVKTWIDALRQIPAEVSLELHECSPPMVDQANMVAGFLGRAKVVSFYASLVCEDCNIEAETLFAVEAVRAAGNKLPPVACKKCQQPMILDDIEENLLFFLRE